jgi:hypothetical protein
VGLRVNQRELLGVRQELGEGGERRLVKKIFFTRIVGNLTIF